MPRRSKGYPDSLDLAYAKGWTDASQPATGHPAPGGLDPATKKDISRRSKGYLDSLDLAYAKGWADSRQLATASSQPPPKHPQTRHTAPG